MQLREDAVGQGLSVSEHGITDTESGEVTTCETEAAVYAKLGYEYIEPELREGRGELKAAREGKLPKLVELGDLKGDLHSHTTLSDGRNTLGEMAEAAKARGYDYLAITDHSASHGFGDHVTAERLWERIEEIKAWNKGQGKGARASACSPARRSTSASTAALDYPDDLVAALDWVVASVHTSFSISAAEMTERVLAAIDNPEVDCIGHLTGRLIGRREPYGIDVEAVAAAAAETGTMIEINGNPNRRDLSDRHARLAVDAGVTILLNTDAHGVDTLDNMQYAVATARRAWLTKADVANTRPGPNSKRCSRFVRRARELGDAAQPGRAQARRPHQLDRAQGVGRDDVELDAVALLDRQHRGLAGVPGERDDQRVAGADHRDAGEEEAEGAGERRR